MDQNRPDRADKPMLDQVGPEGRAHLECPCARARASELAGAGKASHANCVVVSKRTLAAAVAWWWQCMAEWKKGQGRSGEMNVH